MESPSSLWGPMTWHRLRRFGCDIVWLLKSVGLLGVGQIWMFPKIGFWALQIIHFNRVFHYKPSILGVFAHLSLIISSFVFFLHFKLVFIWCLNDSSFIRIFYVLSLKTGYFAETRCGNPAWNDVTSCVVSGDVFLIHGPCVVHLVLKGNL